LFDFPYLAPEIVGALLTGRRPSELPPAGLLRVSINLPHDWNEQRRSLYRAFLSNREPQRRKKLMGPNNTFFAVFIGSKTSPRMTAWNALPEEERRAKQQEGIAAWKAWAEKHHAAIVYMGGPLGKTKKVTQLGIVDTSNEMGAYRVVRADSHEAAAKLFEKHPYYMIFPGDSVEIMPVLPIPGV
jgi:hypothetical protein